MQLVLRSAALFFLILVVTRAMGRKELAEISSFDLILLVVLGDLVQQGVTGDDRSVVGAMLAVATFALLTVGLSYASYRWRRIRPLVEGEPVVIVVDGKPLERILKIERLTQEEVLAAAREHGIQDVRQIRLGVLEANGKFSFLLQAEGSQPSQSDPQERKTQ
jgi:uncharacterized membrane protein YcaP (DUF421 family)